ncbi:MAG: UvrD-helicase domain-containing protein, partial [Hymenobacteraceae bacterium]|nr:UvrD-helicase domain-containing protein [Hymenobacteraceae bacterium]MDX5396896.1 UvrD-helicase domain-containing protein [Hymenobacteraceae bacterium]MDX5512970.1 UvrD-helicase domain-containing protein [Hymenobacteraceae bacterium]
MPSVFKIYSSSAGSGKTYNLTKEYLKLALQSQSPEYYKTILAITFTYDAANEMKERILEALRQFNDSTLSPAKKEKSDNLLRTVLSEIQQEYPDQVLDETVLRKRAQATFQQILYNYSDFAVSTIDSFVNRVVTAFTRELNIPYNFEVDLDTQTLLRTAVGMLMDKVNNYEGNYILSETIQKYALEKAEEGRS